MINRGKLKKTKKRMSPQPKRGYACKWCGSNEHYSYTCFQRPKKPIRSESKETERKRRATRRAWFRQNPPDKNGQWECYLKISEDCPGKVTTGTIDLEHVRSKTRHPKLRFKPRNIKAACQPCNKLKRSWSLEELAETYEQVAAMIATPEWRAYERELDKIEGVGV